MNERVNVAINRLISFATILSVSMPSLLLHPAVAASGEYYEVQDAPLNVSYKKVQYKPVLPVGIRQIVAGSRFAAFSSNRELWIKTSGTNLSPLSKLVPLPVGFDWYQNLCLAGDTLVVSVALYPEEQRQKELATSRGGYRGGPKPVGLLVVNLDPPRVTLTKELQVTQQRPISKWLRNVPLEMKSTPDGIKASMESCHWDGKRLIIGMKYGELAEIDLQRNTVKLLGVDSVQGVSVLAILTEEEGLRVSVSEGGMSGSWIDSIWSEPTGERDMISYRLLQEPDANVDSLVRFKNRLLASSEMGIVQIDEMKRSFTHFRIGIDKSEMPVFGLKAINGMLWGARRDGVVRTNLETRMATVYQLDGNNISNEVKAAAFFDKQWYVATKQQLVTVSIE